MDGRPNLQKRQNWTLQDFIERYRRFYEERHNEPAFCREWAAFHFDLYVREGTIPDFMR